jgi:hypothetical protein
MKVFKWNELYNIKNGLENFEFSPSSMQMAVLLMRTSGEINRGRLSVTLTENKRSEITEYVHLVYVDRDGNVKANKTISPFLDQTINSFDLNLKKGWNAIYIECLCEIPLGLNNFNNDNRIVTLSIANPDNLLWIYENGPQP